MKLAHTIALLGVVAGCSNPQATTDAGTTSDAAGHDGTATADAVSYDAPATVDAPIDSGVPCPSGRLCFQLAPIDGVTNLPAGRIAIAWIAEGNPPQVEVAYDQPWTAAAITTIDVAQIAAPSAGMLSTGVPSCASSFAPSMLVLSTDPDASGSISVDEILNGQTGNSTYGIHQQMVAWFSEACAVDPPDFPDGFAKGIHVYTADNPVHLLDGAATELQTCQPGSAACANLNDPF